VLSRMQISAAASAVCALAWRNRIGLLARRVGAAHGGGWSHLLPGSQHVHLALVCPRLTPLPLARAPWCLLSWCASPRSRRRIKRLLDAPVWIVSIERVACLDGTSLQLANARIIAVNRQALGTVSDETVSDDAPRIVPLVPIPRSKCPNQVEPIQFHHREVLEAQEECAIIQIVIGTGTPRCTGPLSFQQHPFPQSVRAFNCRQGRAQVESGARKRARVRTHRSKMKVGGGRGRTGGLVPCRGEGRSGTEGGCLPGACVICEWGSPAANPGPGSRSS